MNNKKRIKSDFLPQHLKAFAPRNEQNVQGFFRSVVPELRDADDEAIKVYLRSLTMEEMMFVAESCRFPTNNQVHNLSNYPPEVQKVLKWSNNFLLFKGQLETLFILAGGARSEAVNFRRNWNKKLCSTRDGLAAEMHIGEYSLKQIIETLAYDAENHFIISEDLDFVQQVRQFIELDERAGKKLSCTSLTYINYLGDTSGDKRSDVWQKTRTHINLRSIDEGNFWVNFMIVKGGEQHEFHYNLLAEESMQNDLCLMNPTFYQNSGSGQFIFTSTIVWLIDGVCEHFEFGARYRGELPAHVHVVEMI